MKGGNWERDNIIIHILDIHETSLLYKFPRELSLELKEKSLYYKFDHWLKEGIFRNILDLYYIRYLEPLFMKCNSYFV